MREARERHDNLMRTHCTCYRCGWKWTSSLERPGVCPNCHSPWWDREVCKATNGNGRISKKGRK
jgi:predicted Zn-ribbon and HTH transcriptional regulator